jgi:NitT/TauT family transport system substrate-binding protein
LCSGLRSESAFGHVADPQERCGLQVTSLSNGAAIAAAVADGTFDIGQSNTPSLATANERKLPFVMIAPASLYSRKAPPAVGIVVAKNSAIHTGRDLNGKTMAVTGIRNIAQVAIQAWADKNGGDSSTIKFVEMPYRSMAPAIAEGRVDGCFLSEPDLDEALRTVGRSLGTGYGAIADNFVIGAWFCTMEFASAHGDIVKRFATTMAETARWANSHRAQSAQILEKWTRTRVDASMPRVVYGERLISEEIQPLIDAAAKYQALKAPFPADELFAPGVQP